MKTTRIVQAFALASLATTAACKGEIGPAQTLAPAIVKTGATEFSIVAAPTGLEAIRVRVVGHGMSTLTALGTAKIMMQQSVADTTLLLMKVINPTGAFLRVTLDNVDHQPLTTIQEGTAGRAFGYAAFSASTISVVATKQ